MEKDGEAQLGPGLSILPSSALPDLEAKSDPR